MRARIFAAFLAVAAAAFLSNFLFERFVRDDFEDLLKGMREDDIFLVSAAAEGSFSQEGWDREALRAVVQWALMLGYEIRVQDRAGNEIVSTQTWLATIDLWRERRLAGMGALPVVDKGSFSEMPLFLQGKPLGSLFIRPGGDPFSRQMREATFRRRGEGFLWISLGIAAAGTLLFALVLVFSLERPLRRLVLAADRVRSGDLGVIIPSGGGGDLERLRLAFNEMVDTLGRQEERRKRLVSEVAHELRTPLTILRGTVEAMEDGVVPTDKEALKCLSGEIGRLGRLVGGIEELARAESGRFFLEKQSEALDEVVRESVRPFEFLFEEKELSLTVETSPVRADIDAGRMRQLLTNLLSNALRHTENGGVTVTVRREVEPGGDGGPAVIEVRDTGSGITLADRQHIFDRFFRGADVKESDEGTGTGSGLGLGLAIVKEIAEAHGGRVEVESTPGEGSTFRVRIPCRT